MASRPFEDLTERGQTRRLREVAVAALAQYDFEVGRLRLVANDTNTTFRVDTTDGSTYALRVAARDEDTLVHTETELAWLDSLVDEPTIRAAHPHRNAAGDLITFITHPAVPDTRRCVVFDWLWGNTIGEAATAADYRLLGELSARLHTHGEQFALPAGSQPLVWDRVFYYPTEPVVLFEDQFHHIMTPDRARVVETVLERCELELARLHREVPVSICHGDLHPWNVMRYRGVLSVFDFEDLMVAAPVQDIAITLFYNRDRAEYPDLAAGFEQGYRSLREWPVEFDGQLRLLMAARTVMFINYVLRLGAAGLAEEPTEFVPRAVDRIRDVL